MAERHREKTANDINARWRSPRFWLGVSLGLYALLLVGITVNNWVGPDRWWLGSLNLYLPQWLWGLPALVALPFSLGRARRWAWLPVGALIWVAVPLMGLCWGTGEPGAAQGGQPLRVMTYNIKYGQRNIDAVVEEIRSANPDLLLIQDAAATLSGKLGALLEGWHLRAFGQYIIASRFALISPRVVVPETRDVPASLWSCDLDLRGHRVRILDVHLMTPRRGLRDARRAPFQGVEAVEDNAELRLSEGGIVARAVDHEMIPVILAGDLNAPMQSVVCRRLEAARLHDAFSTAGRGYGYTYGHKYCFGLSYVRLDHIFVSRHWRVERCETGSGVGSDHRPVIADLVLAA